MPTPEAELIDRLVRNPKQVLLLIGSGISIATTKNAIPCASWSGLLQNGIKYIEDQGLERPPGWNFGAIN